MAILLFLGEIVFNEAARFWLLFKQCVCVKLSGEQNLTVHCAALVRKKKKVRFFFFGSRHTQGDKLGVSLGGVLGATTTES